MILPRQELLKGCLDPQGMEVLLVQADTVPVSYTHLTLPTIYSV